MPMRFPSFRPMLAVLLAAGFGAATALVFQRVRPREAAAAPVETANAPAETPDEPLADWCAPGFEPVEGGGCLAVPRAMPAASLIVYLHGRYSREAASDEIDRQR